MLVEHDTVPLPARQIGQRTLALFDWNAAQILAIEFNLRFGSKADMTV